MIETARLRLRPPQPTDAPALAALMTDDISQWLARWPMPFTIDRAQARIAGAQAANAAHRGLNLLIEHQGAPAGWIGGGIDPDYPHPTFGYWIGTTHQGAGLMHEAAPPFIDALRSRLALKTLHAFCHPDNRPSARILAACGLRRIDTREMHTPARNRPEWVDIYERTWL